MFSHPWLHGINRRNYIIWTKAFYFIEVPAVLTYIIIANCLGNLHNYARHEKSSGSDSLHIINFFFRQEQQRSLHLSSLQLCSTDRICPSFQSNKLQWAHHMCLYFNSLFSMGKLFRSFPFQIKPFPRSILGETAGKKTMFVVWQIFFYNLKLHVSFWKLTVAWCNIFHIDETSWQVILLWFLALCVTTNKSTCFHLIFNKILNSTPKVSPPNNHEDDKNK